MELKPALLSSEEPVPERSQTLEEFCHNDLFDMLGNRRRRYVLYCLALKDGPIESRELAERITAWESETSQDRIPSNQYQSVYNSLYQTHLPQLETAGFIRYNRSTNTVYPAERIDELELAVDAVSSRWTVTFPTVAILLGGVVTGTALLLVDIAQHVAVLLTLVFVGTVLLETVVR